MQQIRAELRTLLASLPWSVEPHDGWTDPADRWHPTQRPATPGWTEEQKHAVAALRAREMEMVTTIADHPWWKSLTGEDRVAARMALKRALAGGTDPQDPEAT
ncbi:hypothetical protein AB0K89_22980 [Streptomyces cinnamoneus]|uniref:hypothetical protein n=1 Tax=Streptomyces cinnamoneus TaxID=53446 RepID=UPI0034485E85